MSGRKKSSRAASAPRAGADQGMGDEGAEAMLRDATKAVKPAHRERFLAIVTLTDAYSVTELQPLGGEYRDMCRVMAAVLCQKGSPVVEGRGVAEGWAAAIVAAVGFVNFLGDKEFLPFKTMAQVAAGFGVSESGLAAKSVQVRTMLDLGQFDPDWTLPSLLDRNPHVWMLETTTGLVVDARRLPRAEQVRAFEMGLIPYVPADREAGLAADKPHATEMSPTREPEPARHEEPTLFDADSTPPVVEVKPGAADGVKRITLDPRAKEW